MTLEKTMSSRQNKGTQEPHVYKLDKISTQRKVGTKSHQQPKIFVTDSCWKGKYSFLKWSDTASINYTLLPMLRNS